MRKKLTRSLVLVILTLTLVACGNPTATALPLPVSQPTQVAQSSRVAQTQTTQAATSGRPNPTATLAQAKSDLTTVKGEREIVKTFTDAQSRSIKLTYGRGSGHNGDFGWAHILGKHVNRIWYDGGTITTFPQAVGTRTPEEVVDLIGRSLQDKKPDDQGGGRRTYSYEVPKTNKDVFTVVGSDGTIITSYPVAHGSKDEDA